MRRRRTGPLLGARRRRRQYAVGASKCDNTNQPSSRVATFPKSIWPAAECRTAAVQRGALSSGASRPSRREAWVCTRPARAKRASGSKTLGKQSTHPLLREPCQGPLHIARKGPGARARGLLEAKNRSHKPAIAVAISAACARDKEMTASRHSIGCDEPLVQRRSCAAAAMAKAAGQGGRSRHRCCALRAQSNIAARTPPASQNLPRARPRTNRARIRTHAARDATES